MTDMNERVETLRRLIRIRSVQGAAEPGKPYGPGPAAALAEALKIADEMGFKTVNMDNHCGYAEYGSGDEMVMVLGHLDVVPEGEGWSVPPYEGVVKDGKMYGRGTADDKGPVIEALFALRDIKESGTALRRRIRIVFGVNEETGCEDMVYYKENGGEIPVMGITPDACYPLINGEKGILVEDYSRSLRQSGGMKLLSIHGGTAFNVTPSSAEAWISAPEGTVFPDAPCISVRYAKDMKDSPEVPAGATVCIRAEGKSAHGSTPEKGINANGLLVNYLAKLPFEGEAKDALTFLSEKIGMTYHGEGFGVDLHDDVSGWLVNNWGVLDGDAGHISVTLNYRYPVTFHK
ncbi:MAG: Sapep family Mn(2+)-dependent dipeptidase, partial [Lachnospira sp.]|nr:Sapep family Mn(2+)-dependent dipeptidase [Lachnospira sp.]